MSRRLAKGVLRLIVDDNTVSKSVQYHEKDKPKIPVHTSTCRRYTLSDCNGCPELARYFRTINVDILTDEDYMKTVATNDIKTR